MSHLHIEKTRFAANIDVILFLLEMEKIEHINNFWRSHTENYKGYYYEMAAVINEITNFHFDSTH